MARRSARWPRLSPRDTLTVAVRSQPETEGRPMALGFTFRLEAEDGTPADPPMVRTAVPNWNPGDTFPLGDGLILRVIDTRLDEGTDGEPVAVLIVESA
jgi:hypothetical protein